jgi:hypothetical protein
MPTLSYAKLVFQLEERHLTLDLVPCQFFTHVKALKWGITKIWNLGALPTTKLPPLFPCDRWVF